MSAAVYFTGIMVNGLMLMLGSYKGVVGIQAFIVLHPKMQYLARLLSALAAYLFAIL
jgi:hypothetical protein